VRARTLVLSIIVAVASTRACIAHAEAYEIPAEFVSDAASPLLPSVDYAWADIARVSRTGEVLVLGDVLLLRIADEKPFVTLGMQHELDTLPLAAPSIAAPGTQTLVIAYAERTPGILSKDVPSVRNVLLASHNSGRWESLAPPGVDMPHARWRITRLVPSSSDAFDAVVASTRLFVADPRAARFDEVPWLTGLYEYRDDVWSNTGEQVIGPRHRIMDACETESGRLLVVGRVLELARDGTIASIRGFALARAADRSSWTTIDVTPPAGARRTWSLTSVACGVGSRHWLGAEYGTAAASLTTDLFLGDRVSLYQVDEGDGGFHAEPLATVTGFDQPAFAASGANSDRGEHSYAKLAALAVDTDDAVWVSLAGGPGRDLLPVWRYDGSKWTEYPLPPINGVDCYTVRGFAFANPKNAAAQATVTGWAISTIAGGATAPERRGLLLRFRDGAWHIQNWRWSRLRQRGFGLFGSLR